MRTSYQLLQKHFPFDIDSDTLAEKLTMNGLEVEETISYAKKLDKIVVGEILAKNPHPNADKLSVCQVNIGDTSPLSIVCGATNFKEKDKVAVALVGSILPNQIEIKESSLRGFSSSGMLCSTKELGLYDSEGIWILKEDCIIGKPVSDYFPLEDTLYDLSLTPNRGDCLSSLGIAREIAIISQKKFQPNFNFKTSFTQDKNIEVPSIHIKSPYCFKYGALVIQGIKVKESPSWLKEALFKYNLKSVNNIVDSTNYIMMELGQPLHAFDLSKIEKEIIIDDLEHEENFITLNKNELKLPPHSLVIKDSKKTLALAGIIGGENSCVDSKTTDILLESAHFNAVSIALIAQKLHLSTDASYRFVRDIDAEMTETALYKVAELIISLAGGKASESIIKTKEKETIKPIEVEKSWLEKVLGFEITEKNLESIFDLLCFSYTKKNNAYQITPPSYRNDCKIPVDIAEEVVRVYGYENLPTKTPRISATTESSNFPFIYQARDFLAQRGLQEIFTFSFVKEEIYKEFSFYNSDQITSVPIKNPLNTDFTTLRTSLFTSIFPQIVEQHTKGNKNTRIFEIGNIAYKEGNSFQEKTQLFIALSGDAVPESFLNNSEKVSFFDLKGIIESFFHQIGVSSDISFEEESTIPSLHPQKTARILYKKEVLGYLGELHPRFSHQYKIKETCFILEISLEPFLNFSLRQPPFSYQPFSKYPKIHRDLAFLVDENIPSAKMIEAITPLSPLIIEVKPKDIYQSNKLEKSKKSITFSLVFQSKEKTLTDEEINAIIDSVIQKMKTQFQANFREG